MSCFLFSVLSYWLLVVVYPISFWAVPYSSQYCLTDVLQLCFQCLSEVFSILSTVLLTSCGSVSHVCLSCSPFLILSYWLPAVVSPMSIWGIPYSLYWLPAVVYPMSIWGIPYFQYCLTDVLWYCLPCLSELLAVLYIYMYCLSCLFELFPIFSSVCVIHIFSPMFVWAILYFAYCLADIFWHICLICHVCPNCFILAGFFSLSYLSTLVIHCLYILFDGSARWRHSTCCTPLLHTLGVNSIHWIPHNSEMSLIINMQGNTTNLDS